MSEKTQSEVLSLAKSNDSDSEDHLDQYFSLGSRLKLRLRAQNLGSGTDSWFSK